MDKNNNNNNNNDSLAVNSSTITTRHPIIELSNSTNINSLKYLPITPTNTNPSSNPFKTVTSTTSNYPTTTSTTNIVLNQSVAKSTNATINSTNISGVSSTSSSSSTATTTLNSSSNSILNGSTNINKSSNIPLNTGATNNININNNNNNNMTPSNFLSSHNNNKPFTDTSNDNVAIMMKPLNSNNQASSSTQIAIPTTNVPSHNAAIQPKKQNDNFINIGLESIKINGAVQFKQLRNPISLGKETSTTNQSNTAININQKDLSYFNTSKDTQKSSKSNSISSTSNLNVNSSNNINNNNNNNIQSSNSNISSAPVAIATRTTTTTTTMSNIVKPPPSTILNENKKLTTNNLRDAGSSFDTVSLIEDNKKSNIVANIDKSNNSYRSSLVNNYDSNIDNRDHHNSNSNHHNLNLHSLPQHSHPHPTPHLNHHLYNDNNRGALVSNSTNSIKYLSGDIASGNGTNLGNEVGSGTGGTGIGSVGGGSIGTVGGGGGGGGYSNSGSHNNMNSSNSNNNNNNENNNGPSDNEKSALCRSPRLTVRSTSTSSNRKEKKSNIGYRLGERKLLFEKRRQISDYALIFAMTGVFMMIIETEFSMSRLYTKVNFLLN
jgi:hypothetical protein